ncbi:MAG: AAA family ATPase [Candidatus Accumulibacter sp.]|jgi:hypothetical protein|nr:AAA family ATPase [Accumulibacter sp.]
MTIFIPERVGAASARGIHVKRILSTLDDDHVVRTPIRPDNGWSPDFFVQHPKNGWLAIVVADTPSSALADDRSSENEERAAFDKLLADFHAFPAFPGAGRTPFFGKLILLWKCSPQAAQTAAGWALSRFGVRLLSKTRFQELGARLVPRLLEPIDAEMEQAILGQYFPETEIHPASTTRRHFVRDNSAKLQRFFLDHQQEWAAKLDLEPHQAQAEAVRDFSIRLVNGVAGSGKTLIILSRAKLLAELHPDQRVLVLIHNAPIVADIKAKLIRMQGPSPENLEIRTFFSWGTRQWQNIHRRWPKLCDAREVEALIAHHRAQWPALGQPESLLREEFDFINDSLIIDAAHYSEANRAGRGFALRPKERAAVWALFQAVTATLERSGQQLWSAIPREICLAEEHAGMERYDHVLIDEAQFFAPSWFQAVRLAMREQSSLFLCADPNQGFMKNRLSWKSVGLDVAGRTRKLRRSYRTTRAILASANRILARDAPGDPDDFLAPDLSGMEPGVTPILIRTDSPQDSVDRLVNELSACLQEQTVALGDLLVIYGEKAQKRLLYEQLRKRFGADDIWWFNKKEHRKAPPHGYEKEYLRLANLETATGLEAGTVFLIGMENLLSDGEVSGLGKEDRAATAEKNARKLYMAMTRAGQHLILLSSEPVRASIGEGFVECD